MQSLYYHLTYKNVFSSKNNSVIKSLNKNTDNNVNISNNSKLLNSGNS
jgi:hypothetical protein